MKKLHKRKMKTKRTKKNKPTKMQTNSVRKENEMNTPKMPRYIADAFDNTNDVMQAMSAKGQLDLDIYEDKSTKLAITSFGCVIDLKNREGKGFSVLIMDTNDADVFRNRVLLAAEGIKQNFPHLTQTITRPCGV